MNCFAHGRRFLENPYFTVGTAIPDWLTLADRAVRARPRAVAPFLPHPDPTIAALARGITQHYHDDRWFHESPTFTRLNLLLAADLKAILGGDTGFRPGLVAHIAIEMLLDAALAKKDPLTLDRYYHVIASVDPQWIERSVNQMANRPTDRLAEFARHFVRQRYVFDYLWDDGVLGRLNRILRRLELGELPAATGHWVAEARRLVDQSVDGLLCGESPLPPQSAALA